MCHGSRLTFYASLCYALSLLCFALGLMSKPMLVTLPFVLLLLDYWPLRRLALAARNEELLQLYRAGRPYREAAPPAPDTGIPPQP